jgi:hypothetical protein
MYDNQEKYPTASIGLACSPVQESKRDQLEREKTHLLSRVDDINRLLEIMSKNPDTEELINLLRRV